MKNKVYIITPSYRAKNLHIIKKSINFNKIHKWIIIYDIKHLKIKKKLFEDNKHIIELFHKDPESVSGNSQRNFALDYLDKKKNKNLFIYYLDDDNNIHKNFPKARVIGFGHAGFSISPKAEALYSFDKDPFYRPTGKSNHIVLNKPAPSFFFNPFKEYHSTNNFYD